MLSEQNQLSVKFFFVIDKAQVKISAINHHINKLCSVVSILYYNFIVINTVLYKGG